MTWLWLIRHGETDWNVEGRWQGQAESAPPLNETGQRQSHAIAQQLAGNEFAAIYSSDLLRARQTAEIIASRLGLPIQFESRLREINQGKWEGMLGRDIATQYPLEWADRERDPIYASPPDGESAADVATRVWAAADAIATHYPTGNVIIVSHGFALATLICKVRDLPLARAFGLIPDNAHPEIVAWDSASMEHKQEFTERKEM